MHILYNLSRSQMLSFNPCLALGDCQQPAG